MALGNRNLNSSLVGFWFLSGFRKIELSSRDSGQTTTGDYWLIITGHPFPVTENLAVIANRGCRFFLLLQGSSAGIDGNEPHSEKTFHFYVTSFTKMFYVIYFSLLSFKCCGYTLS